MNQIKILILAAACITGASATTAQEVPRNVLVEHFTNTYCSVCASRNPGFYANLWSQPAIMHIAYHPSSPYPACPLNMHNVAENNDRTNYYGVYGGTPRLVIQGVVVANAANYADPGIFSAAAGQTSPFSLRVEVAPLGSDSLRATVTVKKVSASSLTSMSCYGAIVEDTIFVASANGEPRSYDVFRRNLWSTGLFGISLPAAVGDSIILITEHKLHADWNRSHMYALAMLQDGTKTILQAERSATLTGAAGMPAMGGPTGITLFPNPAQNELMVKGLTSFPQHITVYDALGKVVTEATVESGREKINVGMLAAGAYILRIAGMDGALPFTVH